MKQFIFYFSFLIFHFFVLTACTQYSSEYKRAQHEKDSLKLQLTKNEAEMNEMLSLLNSIENDIQSIREAEDFLTIQKDSELSGSKRDQIKSNMLLITETLKKNKQQLAELQEKLNNSNVQSSALHKTIERLTKEINDKNGFIVNLQSDLAKKDKQIKEYSEQVEVLITDIEILEGVSASQSEQISDQERTLNQVFYCFGTKKELKEQNIISGGGLFSKSKALEGNFNRDYFIVIDKRQITAIPLYASKASVKTNHPKDTYDFYKDPEGHLTLEVKDVNRFWSLSKYLVIEVG